MQTVAEVKVEKKVTPGMQRISEMFLNKGAAKPKPVGPVDAGLSSGSAVPVGGLGVSGAKRKQDAAAKKNVDVSFLSLPFFSASPPHPPAAISLAFVSIHLPRLAPVMAL